MIADSGFAARRGLGGAGSVGHVAAQIAQAQGARVFAADAAAKADYLASLCARAETGQLAPRLDPRRFGLDDVEAAYRLLRERGAQGKLVIDIDPEAAGER